MRISDWSSDVCSSDLQVVGRRPVPGQGKREAPQPRNFGFDGMRLAEAEQHALCVGGWRAAITPPPATLRPNLRLGDVPGVVQEAIAGGIARLLVLRSEEHTSELQSLMRISYAVF